MSDSKQPGDKTITVSPATKTLSLNKGGGSANIVRQNFSHGRSKPVVVEVQKKRRIGADGKPVIERPTVMAPPKPVTAAPVAPATITPQAKPLPQAARPSVEPAAPRPPAPPVAARASEPVKSPTRSSGMVLRTLSEEEKQMRNRILVEARSREADDRQRADDDRQRWAAQEEAARSEREAAEARRLEEEERHRREEETRLRAEAEAKRRLGEEPGRPPMSQVRGGPINPGAQRAPTAERPADKAQTPPPRTPVSARAVETEEEEFRRTGVRKGGAGAARPIAPKPEKREIDRRQGRLTLTNALLQDDERNRSIAAMRRRVQRNQRRAMGTEVREKIAREVVLPEAITIQELANRMSERGVDVIRLMMKQGQMHKITDVIDADTAQLIAEELGHSVRRVADSDVEEGLFNIAEIDHDLEPRAPVVTIMGHVDHGKTSLLDALRQTNVVSGEAGGITQHIGAYQVVSPLGGKITFVDTPGHAAFTAMRARGAKVTDIVVLVVAADDGVKPQTVEAISHAKAAKAPIIVAINKVDKPDANALRVRTELLQHDIQVESLGGETLEIEVSAKTGHNLDKLLEAIQLQSELLDLKASSKRLAEAYVVEARLDRGRGPVASVIISRGTLRVGDIVVAGAAWGRVRALVNDAGQSIPEAGPSMPVEILGFSGVPEAGDRMAVVENEARAREVADYRDRQRRDKMQARVAGNRTSLTDMMTQIRSGVGKKEFILVIKGDVQGSVEAVSGALDKLGTEEVGARIIHSGVGGVTESDVTLAAASRAVIIGFNVRASREAREVAERDGIEIRYYNIIYDLVDDVKKAMTGLLAPTFREEMLGNAAILEVFTISKIGKVAGCRVTDGEVQRGAHVRLIRDNVVIHEGKLSQLKRFKDDAKEVTAGQECGMSFENYQDMRAGDVIECYKVIEVQRTL